MSREEIHGRRGEGRTRVWWGARVAGWEQWEPFPATVKRAGVGTEYKWVIELQGACRWHYTGLVQCGSLIPLYERVDGQRLDLNSINPSLAL